MNPERQLVEQLIQQAVTEAKEVKDDLRLRDILEIGTHLSAALVYGLGELDNDRWGLINAINQQQAEIMLMSGEISEDEVSNDVPTGADLTSEEVRDRVDDQLDYAERLLETSSYLTATDKVVLGIVFKLSKALVIQIRELDNDECHTIIAINRAGGQLGILLNKRMS